MDLESLFAFMFSDDLTLEKFVQFIKSINYTEFDDERLKNIKESLKIVLGDLVPKLNIKKYNIFIIVSCLIFSGIASMAWLKIAYALLALSASYRDVIKPVMEYFKDKKRYESGDEVKGLKEVINDIDTLLKFRKNRETAMDLEEVKKSGRDEDLNYINSLINFISARITDIPFDLVEYVSVRFNAALEYFEENKDSEALKKVKVELGRIADIVVECLEMKYDSVIDRDLGVEIKEELNVDGGRY